MTFSQSLGREKALTFFDQYAPESDSIIVSLIPSPVVSSPTNGSHPSAISGASRAWFLSDPTDFISTSLDLEGKEPYSVVTETVWVTKILFHLLSRLGQKTGIAAQAAARWDSITHKPAGVGLYQVGSKTPSRAVYNLMMKAARHKEHKLTLSVRDQHADTTAA